jgi:hypothetical protein
MDIAPGPAQSAGVFEFLKRRYVVTTIVIAGLLVFWICRWTLNDDETGSETPKESIPHRKHSSVTPDERAKTPVHTRQNLQRFMDMRRALRQRRRTALPATAPASVKKATELSDEAFYAAQMKHRERVDRESKIIVEIQNLIDDNHRDAAAELLRDQRQQFPELNTVETHAFNLLARCIEGESIEAIKSGLSFADTHPGSRLSPYLRRICKP